MRIALVDPSCREQGAITHLLEGRGHEVASFANACDALERIKADIKIDAVISDADLAPISSAELCWETRLLAGRQRAIYVLLMSSTLDERTVIESLDCGADDFILKPPRPQELYAKLRTAERVVMLQQELIRLATTDPLTGVYNRRAFFEEASDACREANAGGALSAILFDIDRFKAINDQYGHDVGDQVVRSIAGEAQRDGVIVGRLGGDEFSVLLKGRVLSDAYKFAEGLRQRFAALRCETPEGTIDLTCSLGVSELQPGDVVDDLMKRADLALYRAKEEGRNRVATLPWNSWMAQRPRQAVSLVRSLARQPQLNEERRKGQPPSDALLARICAVIDLLVRSGLSEEGAAQTMVQKLLAAGVSAPMNGNDETGWKRLLAWRANLLDGRAADDVTREYQDLAAIIALIPPHERVERVLEDELWNRRRGVVPTTPANYRRRPDGIGH